MRGFEETVKKGGGLRRKEFPKLSEAAWVGQEGTCGPASSQPSKATSPCFWGQPLQKAPGGLHPPSVAPSLPPHTPGLRCFLQLALDDPSRTTVPSALSEQCQEPGEISKQDCLSPKLLFLWVVHCPPCILTHQQWNRSLSSVPRGLSNRRAKLL